MVRRFFSGFDYELTPAATDRTAESLARELDRANVVKAVIPGRQVYETTNEELFDYAAQDPERFLVFPFLDVAKPEEALETIERDVVARGAGPASGRRAHDSRSGAVRLLVPARPGRAGHRQHPQLASRSRRGAQGAL
ncbi:hypothetical protein [Bifidobacterium avesanii]|uniref:Uncharacterized protein n=1 Tax=Bifidobacterium avesanii TaxID=1798157 RepID=A0A7K3TG41_9BIFI|nr:hypothetical protein [Bifidobacterium avesanii]NEG77649.1 hypothetical protein [Bifidobacterium avesanii]